jgi:hypothetical protein
MTTLSHPTRAWWNLNVSRMFLSKTYRIQPKYNTCTHTDRVDVKVDKDMHTVGALTASPSASAQMSRSTESASIYVHEIYFFLAVH